MSHRKKLPSISIVIPCLLTSDKHIAMTCRCIDTVLRHTTIPYEIVLIENSKERYLEDEGYVYLHSLKSLTFAENVNKGLLHSKSDYVVVLSNDVFVEDGWLEGLLKCFENPLCGVACPLSKQFNMRREDKIEFGFFGAIFMLKRQVLLDVGYLDERFVNSFEDSDYWIRIMKAGFRLLMNRNVMVEHLVGATEYGIDSHTENYRKNQKLFIEKHNECGLDIFADLK